MLLSAHYVPRHQTYILEVILIVLAVLDARLVSRVDEALTLLIVVQLVLREAKE